MLPKFSPHVISILGGGFFVADIVCMGEALIDFVAMEPCRDVGEACGFIRAAGGAPANVAAGAARLGFASSFLGKVGDDPFGRYIERMLAAAGVDVSGMVFDKRRRTGLAFVSLAENGERNFCFFRNPSADMSYSSAEVDLDAIDSGKIFHFGSITLIDAAPKDATLNAVEHAAARGKLISFDPNLRPPLWSSLSGARSVILEAAKFAHVVKVSEEELCFLFSKGHRIDEQRPSESEVSALAKRFLRRFSNMLLLTVTRGDRGSMWWTPGGLHGSHAGFKVRPVDTTGAGDGFVAGLLTGLLQIGRADAASLKCANHAEFEALIARANAAGALATTCKGAIPAMPNAEELEELLALRLNKAD